MTEATPAHDSRIRLAWRSTLRKAFFQRVPFSPTFDRLYSLAYHLDNHRRLPRRHLYNDRIFWLRWNGEMLDPLRQFVTDKIWAKEFIRARVGEEFVIKTLAVLACKQEVLDYEFPECCVIKPSHGSGDVILCRDGTADRQVLISWLHYSHYRRSREQNYAFLRPRIIVEEFAFGPDNATDDYKFFCVQGVPRAIRFVQNRFTCPTATFYDTDWMIQPYWSSYPSAPPAPRPANLEQMLSAAATLSQGFSQVRVDLYSNGASIKVGEITNLHGGGGGTFRPEGGELAFSNLLFGEADKGA